MKNKNIELINKTTKEISETFNKISKAIDKAIDIATISIKEFGEIVSKIREEEEIA